MNASLQPYMPPIKSKASHSASNTASRKATRDEMDDFWAVLKKYDALQAQINAEKERRKTIEDKELREKKARQVRIYEIRGLIAHYRQKLAINMEDRNALAQISMLQAELSWLLIGI